MTYGWIWIGVIAISVALTLITKKNLISSVAAGALVAVILDIVGINGILWQALALVGASLVFALVFTLFLSGRNECCSFRIDSLIGQTCTVEERIDNASGTGQVSVAGSGWSARAVNEETVYEIGTTLRIVAVEGVKLICME